MTLLKLTVHGHRRLLLVIYNPPCLFRFKDVRHTYLSFVYIWILIARLFRKKNIDTIGIFPSSVRFCQDMGQEGADISSEMRGSGAIKCLSIQSKKKRAGLRQNTAGGVCIGVPPLLDHNPPSGRINGQHISDTFSFSCREFLLAHLSVELFSSHRQIFILCQQIFKKMIGPIKYMHICLRTYVCIERCKYLRFRREGQRDTIITNPTRPLPSSLQIINFRLCRGF